MGSEAKCTAQFKGKTATGTARLETNVLQFRSADITFSIPFASMKKVVAKDGALAVTSDQGAASLALGAAAVKWAEKIKNPPSRLQKIGVKPAWRCSALGVDDESFLAELERAVAFLSIGRAVKESDAIFYGVTREAQLPRLETLKSSIKQ